GQSLCADLMIGGIENAVLRQENIDRNGAGVPGKTGMADLIVDGNGALVRHLRRRRDGLDSEGERLRRELNVRRRRALGAGCVLYRIGETIRPRSKRVEIRTAREINDRVILRIERHEAAAA